MNQPSRAEKFVLPEGVRKLTFTRDTKVSNAGTFIVQKEDHTLGNTVRMQLHRDPNVVLVGRSQTGNPLLRHVRCVRWAFADVLPDFVLGDNACAVFVSLRYHLLHPKYLATKIASLQRAFRLRAEDGGAG